MLPEIRSFTREELLPQFEEWGEPVYRLTQLLEWVYAHQATSWQAMTSLPKTLRARLAETYAFRPLELVQRQGSRDTTEKHLWRLHDRSLIESVLIPANPAFYGEGSDRHTLCVSTQVGCAYGCRFCASGLDGLKRNLGVEEMVDQVLAVERMGGGAGVPGVAGEGGRVVNNLVIMGMGEPLANYDHLIRALRILNAPWGGGIGARRITVSTSGVVPRIKQLADESLQLRLAISLHGATDEIRERIMPVNRKYPLSKLMEACDYYQEKKGRMITFEYILIAGLNDGEEQIPLLAQLARRQHAKVNLIPYNRVEGLSWERPSEAVLERFRAGLEGRGVTVTLRREKGHDIDAACGQLRLKAEKDTNPA